MGTHTIRRVLQTPRAFSNWPSLLAAMAGQRLGRGRDVLRFETRSGLVIDCPNRPGARVPVYEMFGEDCYRLRDFLGSLLYRPINVLDIGGHIGTFACRLAELHPWATIRSFEPSVTTAFFYQRNVAQNGFEGRASVDNRALAAHTGGYLVMEDNEAGSGENRVQVEGQRPGGTTGTFTKVECVSLDDAARSLPGPVDVVKIDCEGSEYELVYASSPVTWASVQRVVVEYHPVHGQSWAELHRFLVDLGFQVAREEPRSDTLGSVWLSREPLPALARLRPVRRSGAAARPAGGGPRRRSVGTQPT
ncbi:MAG TPA: FkbM family methyltransferase [Acidimicrobiales bacterium]|nr:FkbM family methyltransferase [Acidimicrobiales bacterium]